MKVFMKTDFWFVFVIVFIVEVLVIGQLLTSGFSSVRNIITGIFGLLMFLGLVLFVYLENKR